MTKFELHDLHAAPLADLDQPHELRLCAACGELPTHLLCGTWRNAPPGYHAPEVVPDPLIQQVHAALGTNFDFAACDQHLEHWGRLGGPIREVPVGSSAVLRFARVS